MISIIRKKPKPCITVALLMTICILSGQRSWAGVGESAVITLIFPPGARATALGEAFTGLSDDASATYYNPAGLGQAPMANSWKVHFQNSDHIFTSIAAKKKKDFGTKDKIWAGTEKGILRFNGKVWESYEIYLIEEGDNLSSIARKFLRVDDEKLIKNAVWEIMVQNGIGQKRYAVIREQLKKELKQLKVEHVDSTASALARQLVEMPAFERSVSKIQGIIAQVIDFTRADTLSEELDNLFLTSDTDFKDLEELKIPFSVAINEPVTALALDQADHIWIGTKNGLWRYNGSGWFLYTVLDGLPSNNITCLSTGPYGDLAAGTDNGVAISTSGKWKAYDSTSGLPASVINAVVFGQQRVFYAGTNKGLARVKDSTVTVFDTAQGLLSLGIHALFMDSENRLWIGSDNGVTIYTGTSWKRYKFPDSKVTSFTELKSGNIWIGTNKGAVSYKAGKIRVDEKGNTTEMPPEWKSFHSKNALIGDDVRSINVHDNDVWIVTDKAINQYDNAAMQAYLSFEPLLPALGLRELWHMYGAFIWPTQDWGTLGLSINYINMGENTITDALGREKQKTRSWEGVFNLSYGLPVAEDFSLGLNIKYVVSALAPGYGDNGEGVGQTFAIDAGLLKRNLLFKNFDVGFMLQNMGPHIFYIDRDNLDPIPFTLRLGMVYRALQTPIHDLKLLVDLQKEVVKNNFGGKPDPFYKALITDLLFDDDETFSYEMQEININLGLEYWYTNFLALRTGFLFDYIGERYEWTLGLGVRYSKLNFDWSYIVSPEGFMKGLLQQINSEKDGGTGVRDGQWRASFLVNF